MRTTSSWWLLSMAEVFKRMRLPVEQLFCDARLSVQSLAHPDTRFPQDGVTRLWEAAALSADCDYIGLEVGQRISVSGFPVLGYSFITARGIVEGFQRFQRYQSLIGESANIQPFFDSGKAYLIFQLTGDDLPISCHAVDAAMASLVSMARVMEGDNWSPQSVQLIRDRPKKAAIFEDYYQCDVLFAAERNALRLDTEQVKKDFTRFPRMLDSEALPPLDAGKPIAELVEMLIRPRLQDGLVSREWLCERLGISVRTLQRRLANEGESYQRIIDRTREDLALEYLKTPKMSLNEVAFLCGFSDLPAFHNAFKRWRNQTPGEYKASLNKKT